MGNAEDAEAVSDLAVLDDLRNLAKAPGGVTPRTLKTRRDLARMIFATLKVSHQSVDAVCRIAILKDVLSGVAAEARSAATDRLHTKIDWHLDPQFQAAGAAELFEMTDEEQFAKVLDQYYRNKAKSDADQMALQEELREKLRIFSPARRRQLRAAVWMLRSDRNIRTPAVRDEMLQAFIETMTVYLYKSDVREGLMAKVTAGLESAVDTPDRESIVATTRDSKPVVVDDTSPETVPTAPRKPKVAIRWPAVLSTLTLALVIILANYIVFPLLPRPFTQPIQAINEAVLSGFGLALVTLPAGFRVWVIWNRVPNTPRMNLLQAAFLAPLVAYLAIMYGNYFAVTSDARTIKQQAADEWKVLVDEGFDGLNPCLRDDPGGPNCDEASGTMRLVGTGTLLGAPSLSSGLATFTGDFYAETSYRPRGESSWDNCFIEVTALESTLFPRDFRLASLSGDAARRYVATIARAGTNDQNLALADVDFRPVPFVGVRSIPGWSNGSWTKLGVARIGAEYKFFVNDRPVLTSKVSGFKHNTTVQMGGQGNSPGETVRCEFDYFRLWAKVE